ncbi:multidrug resistance protein [Xylariaceae sp. FL0255]|nr:multidrug resistance protein [Xylariaceae sp. FL0255]
MDEEKGQDIFIPEAQANDDGDNPELPSPPSREVYSVFTKSDKRIIVALVSFAAWFSTVSSFIYYPALAAISKSLSVPLERVNLTITTYMSVATIAPTLVGDAADVLGRRAMYAVTFTLYVAACVAIALVRSFPALLGLRVLQALAISGTFSIAYGVITDLASPAERGSYVSMVSFAITIAPSIGPILGGTLTYARGWTWIFWFLVIAAGTCLTAMILFLPETTRSVVGNGSVTPPKYLRIPFTRFMCHWEEEKQQNIAGSNRYRRRIPNPLRSLVILTYRDNLVIVLACGLLYAVYTCLNASLSVLCIQIYNLTEWQAGLIYLPFGLGGSVSTFFSGPLLDSAYRNARRRSGLTTDKVKGDDLDSFPVEKARLQVIWVPMLLTTASVVGFGWALHFRQHLALVLALQFIVGLVMQLDFSIYNTLLVDKNTGNPSAAQASSNIVRCTFAAVLVAFLQQLVDAITIGGTFTLMGGLCIVATLLFLVDFEKGTSWRRKRIAKARTSMRR